MSIEDLKGFGKRFKQLRVKELDLDQVELASLMEVTQATISAIETGKSKGLKLENLIKLSLVCEELINRRLSLDWLVMDFGAIFITPFEKSNTEFDEEIKKEGGYFDENGFYRKKQT